MTDLNITIFGLDDDIETLDIIERIFLDNGIGNYKLFYKEDDFCANFTDQVHIAIIDHYINGEPRGFEIMKKIFEHNKNRAIIDCRVIIISGQQDAKMISYYLNEGAKGYIDKNDRNFNQLLISYVQRQIVEVKKILSFIQRQQEFLTNHTKER